MKILKSLLFVSLVSFLPAFAYAGGGSGILAFLLKNSGDVLRVRPLQNIVTRNNLGVTRFVQYYGTQNGGGNQDDPVNEGEDENLVPGAQPQFGNQDNVPQAHNPYCPHQAEWPERVARGELPLPAGTVFSDMLMQRYLQDQTEVLENEDEGKLERQEDVQEREGVQFQGGTIDLVLERTEDEWVRDYLEGHVIIDGTPPMPPGIMGEQVLDLVRAVRYGDTEVEDQEDLVDFESSNDDEGFQRLVEMVNEQGWTPSDARRIHQIAERYTNDMTGVVNLVKIEQERDDLNLFMALHRSMVRSSRLDYFDVQDYSIKMRELIDALDKLIEKK